MEVLRSKLAGSGQGCVLEAQNPGRVPHSDLIVVLISTVHRPECDTEGKFVPGAQGLALR